MKKLILLVTGVIAILGGSSLALLLLPLAGVQQPRLDGLDYARSVLDGLLSAELRRGTFISLGLLLMGTLCCVGVCAPRRTDTELHQRDYLALCGSIVVGATMALCGVLATITFYHL